MNTEQRAPLIEHIRELRARVFWCLLFVVLGAVGGYILNDRLLEIIQRPIKQTLYYTAPTGALTFVLKICVTFGIIVGLPAIMYHLFAFLGPLLSRKNKLGIAFFTILSMVLAVAGVLFSYLVTLPAALHFLVGFGSKDIRSMITADEYFSFAFAYIVGFAVLFQIPLLLLFINRIHRLPPRKLLASIRYVIVICFVASAIITPTPDPLNQTLMAAPAIGLYLVSSIVVTIINWRYWRRQKRRAQAPLPIKPGSPATTSLLSDHRPGDPVYPIKREFVKQPVPLPTMAAKSTALPLKKAFMPAKLPANHNQLPLSRPSVGPRPQPGPLSQTQLAARLRPHSQARIDAVASANRPLARRPARPAPLPARRPVVRPTPAKTSYALSAAPRNRGIRRRPGFISDFVSS